MSGNGSHFGRTILKLNQELNNYNTEEKNAIE